MFVLGYASDRAKPFRANDGKGLFQEPGKVPERAGATISSLGYGLYSILDLATLNALPDPNKPVYQDNNPLVRPLVFTGRTIGGVWKTTEEVGNAVTWGLFDNVTGCVGLVIEDIVEFMKHAGQAVTNVVRAPFHLAAGKKPHEGTDQALDWVLLVPLELASNAVEMKGFSNMEDYKTAFADKGRHRLGAGIRRLDVHRLPGGGRAGRPAQETSRTSTTARTRIRPTNPTDPTTPETPEPPTPPVEEIPVPATSRSSTTRSMGRSSSRRKSHSVNCGCGRVFGSSWVLPLSAGVAVLGQRLRLRDLAVAQGPDDFEDLGPRRERPGVGPLVLVDGHDELELLVGHLALFGGLAFIAASPAGTPHAVQTQTPVHDALAAVAAAAAIGEIRIVGVAAEVVLSSVGESRDDVLVRCGVRR